MKRPDDECCDDIYALDEDAHELFRAAQIGLTEGRVDEYLEYLCHLAFLFEACSAEVCLQMLKTKSEEMYQFVTNLYLSETQLEYLLFELCDPNSSIQTQVEIALYASADIRALKPVMDIHEVEQDNLTLEIITEIAEKRATDERVLVAVPLFKSILQSSNISEEMIEWGGYEAGEYRLILALHGFSRIASHQDMEQSILEMRDRLIDITRLDLDSGVTEIIIEILARTDDPESVAFLRRLATDPIYKTKVRMSLAESVPPDSEDLQAVQARVGLLLASALGGRGANLKGNMN
ncbi:hypothetical protein ACFL2V_04470 [Pseudomonadota bacterium]